MRCTVAEQEAVKSGPDVARAKEDAIGDVGLGPIIGCWDFARSSSSPLYRPSPGFLPASIPNYEGQSSRDKPSLCFHQIKSNRAEASWGSHDRIGYAGRTCDRMGFPNPKVAVQVFCEPRRMLNHRDHSG